MEVREKSGIGQRVRTLRTERAMTQSDLGQAAGVSADAVMKIERSYRRPRASTLRELAKALGTSVEYLTSGSAAEPSAPVMGDERIERVVMRLLTEGGDSGQELRRRAWELGGERAADWAEAFEIASALGEDDPSFARSLEGDYPVPAGTPGEYQSLEGAPASTAVVEDRR